jgi:hypothetical protein
MAHRVAELLQQAEGATVATDREAAARECAHLVQELWQQRDTWPGGGPLRRILPTLERLLGDVNHPYPWASRLNDDSGLMGQLLRLHEQELRLFQQLVQASLPPEVKEASADLLTHHWHDLDDDERYAVVFVGGPPVLPAGEAEVETGPSVDSQPGDDENEIPSPAPAATATNVRAELTRLQEQRATLFTTALSVLQPRNE